MVIEAVAGAHAELAGTLGRPVASAFPRLQRAVVDLLSSLDGSRVRGETSCLLVARKGHHVWWLSIGDCVLYVLHPEYARLGQFAVNQRSFFEWIGQVNTFREAVPCFTTGVKRLRGGRNTLVALTDGVLECGNRPFGRPERLHAAFSSSAATRDGVERLLREVRAQRGRDSATVVAWSCTASEPAPYPSDWQGPRPDRAAQGRTS